MPDYSQLPVSDGEEMTFMATVPLELGDAINELAECYQIPPSLLVLCCIQSALASDRRFDVAGRAFEIHLGYAELLKREAETQDQDDETE